QSAFWVGLLYDPPSLEAAVALTRGIGWADAAAARDAVPRLGLAAPLCGRPLREWAREAVAIAGQGLRNRNLRDSAGRDESAYLLPLQAQLSGEPTQAERWLARFHEQWRGDVRPIFAESAV
ncbi:MAG: glutamate--cysteine ligase, partial [Solirubrobacteraceae bacterium]